MKKLSVVLAVTAILAFLLGSSIGTSAALARPLPRQPASPKTTVTATGGSDILTIPASAFTPFEDGYDYENDGPFLKHFHSPGGGTADGWYYAPVELPQGATVTKTTFHWKVITSSSVFGTARLQRTKFSLGNYKDMAYAESETGGTGFGSTLDDTIDYAVIDNSQYGYWVVLDLPASPNQVWGCGVVIEYTPPATPTGILSVPAAAFIPSEDGYDYENDGRYLFTNTALPGSQFYFAALELPQGATLTKMTFHWYDASASTNVNAEIQRSPLGFNSVYNMAYVESTGSSGYGATHDNAISLATIDNSQYLYWLKWDIPPENDLRGCGTVIEYTLPTTQVNTGLLSIPVASFKQYEDGYDYMNDGNILSHYHSPGGGTADGLYLAQVQLPQGVTVTKVTFNYYKTWASGNAGGITLQRTQFGQGNSVDMASMDMAGPGTQDESVSDDTIDYAIIDNSQYGYWAILDLPISVPGVDDQQIWGFDLVIEYSYQIHLPLVLR